MPITIDQILVSAELGGAGLIALNVAAHLQTQGRASKVWIPGKGKAWSEAEKLDLPIGHYAAADALRHWKIWAALANWRLSRQLKKGSSRLVHVHAPLFYGALRKGLGWAGVKRVVHVHLEESVGSLRWAFRQPPEMIVTCARFLVDLVERSLPETALPRPKVVAIPNAVDTTRFLPGDKKEARSLVGAAPDRPLLLMLANLAPHKGQETAIRAIALLRRQGIDVSLWLAGIERNRDWTYTEELTGLVKNLGVQDLVRFLGHRDDAPMLLRAADCFLLPSTHEGLPLTVLEAQASGTAVVAAPTAGVPEVIRDGETGFLVAAADVAGYAHRISLILNSRETGERIAAAALAQTRQEHSWPAYCRRVEELYASLLGASELVGRAICA